MNTPVTVSRTASPAALNLPLKADDSFIFDTHDETRLEIRDAAGWLVATVHGSGADCTAKARRLRSEIVRACNSHAQLVAALERMVALIDTDIREGRTVGNVVASLESARAALTAAKGVQS